MFKLERRCVGVILNHWPVVLAVAVTLLALCIRACCYDYLSWDAETFLLPWWDVISTAAREGGNPLAPKICDYSITYQAFIWLGTLVMPTHPILFYKGTAFVADIFMAVEGALIVRRITGSRMLETFCYCALLVMPTVFIESGLWAQCDSIFTALLLASLRRLMGGRYHLSLLLLGFAVAFKLQAVFILPFYLYAYLALRRFSIFDFLFVPLGWYLLCMPGFAFGRSLLDPLLVYFDQTGGYPELFLNIGSFWAFLGPNSTIPLATAVVVALTVLTMGLTMLLVRYLPGAESPSRHDIELPAGGHPDLARAPSDYQLLMTAGWTVFTCVFFLPSMHERYLYPAGVLFFLAWICRPDDARLLVAWVLVEVEQTVTYCYFLFPSELISLTIWAAVLLASWILFSWRLFAEANAGRHQPPTS